MNIYEEREEAFLVNAVCVICHNPTEKSEEPLCEKCADMMNPWYPSLMKSANKLGPQHFITMNSQ